MAIFHLSVSHGSRSGGQSAVAKVGYIGREAKYADRPGLEHVEDGNLPAWSNGDARAFWSAVDEHSRANARLFTEVEVALPRELDRDRQIELARLFADELSTRAEGKVPFRLALHSDGGNPHVHLVLSSRIDDRVQRPAVKDWFNQVASKRSSKTVGGAPSWSRSTDKEWLAGVRERWSDLANRQLARSGEKARIDHRSHAARGIDRVPTVHEGWQPRARDRARLRNFKARRANAELVDSARLVKELEQELERQAELDQARAAREKVTAQKVPDTPPAAPRLPTQQDRDDAHRLAADAERAAKQSHADAEKRARLERQLLDRWPTHSEVHEIAQRRLRAEALDLVKACDAKRAELDESLQRARAARGWMDRQLDTRTPQIAAVEQQLVRLRAARARAASVYGDGLDGLPLEQSVKLRQAVDAELRRDRGIGAATRAAQEARVDAAEAEVAQRAVEASRAAKAASEAFRGTTRELELKRELSKPLQVLEVRRDRGRGPRMR